MKRKALRPLLAFLLNLPWVYLWWRFSDPGVTRGLSVPALYLLLVIGTVSMVILPLALGGARSKRWLLIVVLGATNLFWCLRWIAVFASTPPDDTDYAASRHSILLLMFISSLVVGILYVLADRLLLEARRRWPSISAPTPPPNFPG